MACLCFLLSSEVRILERPNGLHFFIGIISLSAYIRLRAFCIGSTDPVTNCLTLIIDTESDINSTWDFICDADEELAIWGPKYHSTLSNYADLVWSLY